jgi:phenylacetic acid degradation protein
MPMSKNGTIPAPMVWRFRGHTPEVHRRAYVHPSAVLIGEVHIGERCYIGPGVVLRGDNGAIHILEGCNLQDGVVVHSAPRNITLLERHSHIGHGAILHGCHIGEHAFVGVNSVVMDRAQIGSDAWVAAMSYVREGFELPAGMLAVGSPARVAKELKPEQIAAKRRSTQGYLDLAEMAHEQSALVDAVREGASGAPSLAPMPGWGARLLALLRPARARPAHAGAPTP